MGVSPAVRAFLDRLTAVPPSSDTSNAVRRIGRDTSARPTEEASQINASAPLARRPSAPWGAAVC